MPEAEEVEQQQERGAGQQGAAGGSSLAADPGVLDRLASEVFAALGAAFGSDGEGASSSDASESGEC